MNIIELKSIINNWWMILISGLLFVGLGIWIIASPLESYFTISLFFAAVIAAAGIMELIFTWQNHKTLSGWVWYLAGGVVDVFVGGYLMAFPLVTMIILPILFGVWMLFRGTVAVSHSLHIRHNKWRGSDWFLIAGIIIILLAILIIINPALGVVNFITWTSLAFIISGIFRIALAIRLRSIS